MSFTLQFLLPFVLLALLLAAPRRGGGKAGPLAKAAAVLVLVWGLFGLLLALVWEALGLMRLLN
jgi:hypothetical protein